MCSLWQVKACVIILPTWSYCLFTMRKEKKMRETTTMVGGRTTGAWLFFFWHCYFSTRMGGWWVLWRNKERMPATSVLVLSHWRERIIQPIIIAMFLFISGSHGSTRLTSFEHILCLSLGHGEDETSILRTPYQLLATDEEERECVCESEAGKTAARGLWVDGGWVVELRGGEETEKGRRATRHKLWAHKSR